MSEERERKRREPREADLPALEPARDTEKMGPHLAEVLGAPAEAQIGISVRHVKPGRHALLTYEMSWETGTRRAIGKVFAKARRAERLWQILQSVDRASNDVPGPAPKPLALLEENQVVVMEFLEGPELLSLMLTDDLSGAESATREGAAALAAFHSIPTDPGKLGTLDEELGSLRKHLMEYGAQAPDLTARISALLVDVEETAARLPQAQAPSLVHTGMRPAAVIVSGERAAFLDLDGWAEGDPAMDLGCFCAEVWNEARQGGRPDLLSLRDVFLAEYGARSGVAGAEKRAPLYEAFTLIRLTLRRLRRLDRDSADRHLSLPDEALLERAEECLRAAVP